MMEPIVSSRVDFIVPKVKRAIYLLSGLREAFRDLGQPDLIDIVTLIDKDLHKVNNFCQLERERVVQEKAMNALSDLRDLIAPLAPEKEQMALRVANHIFATNRLTAR